MAACRSHVRSCHVLVVLLVLVAMGVEGQHRPPPPPPPVHRPPSSQVVDGVQRFRQVLRLYKGQQRDPRPPPKEEVAQPATPVPPSPPPRELRPPGPPTRPRGPPPPIRPPEPSLQPPGLPPKRLPASHTRPPPGPPSRPFARPQKRPGRVPNDTWHFTGTRPSDPTASRPSPGVSRVPKGLQRPEGERKGPVSAAVNTAAPGGSSPLNGLDDTRHQKPLMEQNLQLHQDGHHTFNNVSRVPSSTTSKSPEDSRRPPPRGPPQVSGAVKLLDTPAGEELPWESGPEIPRVPDIPVHLPVDLTNRLKEFPKLAESLQEASVPASIHSFFEPKIEVQAEELSDEEWEEYLESEWGHEGVVPDLLASPPPFLANLKYGDHLCVHLGNPLTPAHTRKPPMSLQFPGEARRRYTIVLLELGPQNHDHHHHHHHHQQQQQQHHHHAIARPQSSAVPPPPSAEYSRPPRPPPSSSSSTQHDPSVAATANPPFTRLLWLVINAPPDQPSKGETVVEYEGPRPAQGTGRHRVVVLVYEQKRGLHPTHPHLPPAAKSCQAEGREGVDVTLLARNLSLQGPVAANYYTSEWDVTVEHACPASTSTPSDSESNIRERRQCDSDPSSPFQGRGTDPPHATSELCT